MKQIAIIEGDTALTPTGHDQRKFPSRSAACSCAALRPRRAGRFCAVAAQIGRDISTL
jgi:hypothetical protein